MSKGQVLIVLGVLILVTGASVSWQENDEPEIYHDWDEIMRMSGGEDDQLPQNANSMFTGSGRCGGCHGHDPNGYASMTADSVDVNPRDDWRATMMANSAKDPFWQAKVAHEVAINPDHQVELEDKCTACHSPMGHFAAHFDGAEYYSMAEAMSDSLALDGVSCGPCHQQNEMGIGSVFSGDLSFQTDTVYGPYGNDPEALPIFNQPMLSFVGYDAVFGDHVNKSELCAGCHTLITNTVDLEGEFSGGEFVEQATYHEWLNSSYSDPDTGQECQGCHFPQIDEPIVISSNYIFLQGREPYGLHYMVGGNTFMLELMKDNIDQLGLWASEEQFQTVIDRTMVSLQEQSALVELEELGIENDTAYYQVKLTNLTGHKFPSGYPSRRAYIEFVALSPEGDTLFKSGVMNSGYEVLGQDPVYEPHYEVISEEDEVQIYQLVMGDVNGDVTTVLERAADPLKDNRLVPAGFSTTHFAYDTTKMAGLVINDSNFNYDSGVEGSGTDLIEYRVGLNGYIGAFEVTANLMYQSVPPKWNEELFAVDHPKINEFEEMYWESGPDPVLIDSQSWQSVVVGVDENQVSLNVYPNPTRLGYVTVESSEILSMSLFDAQGRKLRDVILKVGSNRVDLPSSGTYYLSQLNLSNPVVIRLLAL